MWLCFIVFKSLKSLCCLLFLVIVIEGVSGIIMCFMVVKIGVCVFLVIEFGLMYCVLSIVKWMFFSFLGFSGMGLFVVSVLLMEILY